MAVGGIEKKDYYVVVVGEEFEAKTLAAIRGIVEKAEAKGYRTVIFDVSACTHMDSSAIGLLVGLYKRCDAKGGRIGVLSPSSEIRQILSVANMEQFVHIYESESQIQ